MAMPRGHSEAMAHHSGLIQAAGFRP